ncbi:hypothetical protein [Microbacterium sp. TNHR37B]|uniref:hypothetical protein n=1 Tax=Microbacterium sp. TNHR37B TaxID=1775956 RepID=UPI0007B18CE8|nr:hypothetical protein [Microbacterium sp. TNHR37B]KZE91203.1 hypothetical protein AVP41_00740 [Microbacterium sp. TNHR37B]
MRRVLSLQATRALFGTLPRIGLVVAVLAAYYVAAIWIEPFVPWWVVAVVGLLLLAGLQYLGYRLLERDIVRSARDDSHV